MIRLTRDRSFYRTMFLVALPSAFQSLITQLVHLADTKMVSHLPGFAMAGVGQTNEIANVFVMTVIGLVSGATVLVSQYWGKRDLDRIKQVFSIVLKLVLALAVLVAVLVSIFPEQVLSAFNSDQAVVAAAMPYITVFCLSFIPYALTQALIGVLRAVEVVNVSLIVSSISLVVNISLNYVLIFGKLGLPAMGVRGAAIATLITRVVELTIVAIYAFKVQKALPLKPKDLLKSEGWLWRDYAKYGLPVGLADAQWAIVGLVKTWIIGHLGGVMISANIVASQMMTLGTLFCFALANGAAVVIGKTVGAGNYEKTREYSVSIQWMFLGFGIIFAALVFVLRGPFVGLFPQENPEVASLAIAMIALGAPTMIGTCYHASCFVGINRGAGDSRFVMIVDMICGWLVVLPLSLLAAFVWKVPHAWMFLFLRIDQCFKWIIAFIRLRGNKWIKNVTRD
ncbi:MATE family efflux transporter [Eubacteriales bacterium OttesenSCG-928-N13]|nr:MATE family efflux transporter [Eubacteriales bacterium OttesenSCG-928-N13]